MIANQGDEVHVIDSDIPRNSSFHFLLAAGRVQQFCQISDSSYLTGYKICLNGLSSTHIQPRRYAKLGERFGGPSMIMSHYHPFQKLCYICQAGGISLLLAAVGPHVLALDLKNGGMVSKWPEDVISSAENGDLARNSMNDDPPIKRRKLSPSHEGEHQDSSGSSVSVEFVSERTKGQRRKKKKILKSPSPNISHIISTANGRHVIAVTAEDKRIRVFELTTTGGLKLLSER